MFEPLTELAVYGIQTIRHHNRLSLLTSVKQCYLCKKNKKNYHFNMNLDVHIRKNINFFLLSNNLCYCCP